MDSLDEYKILKPGLPEEGEYVIARVVRIENHGIYVKLIEYNAEAYIPIHEISSGWVANIRSYVKMDQILVVKIERVDREKGLVDASIKRVESTMRKKKMKMWREENDAARSLAIVCIRNGIGPKEYEEISKKLILKFGSLADFMYQLISGNTPSDIENIISKKILDELKNEAESRITVRQITVSGIIEVSFPKDPEGVNKVRDVLLQWKEENIPKNVDVEVYLVGSPKYRIDVVSEDAKEALKYMQNIAQRMENRARELGGNFAFTQLKKKKK